MARCEEESVGSGLGKIGEGHKVARVAGREPGHEVGAE